MVYVLPNMPLTRSHKGQPYKVINGYGTQTHPYTSVTATLGGKNLLMYILPHVENKEVYIDFGEVIVRLFTDPELALRAEPVKLSSNNLKTEEIGFLMMQDLSEVLAGYQKEIQPLSHLLQDMINWTCLAAIAHNSRRAYLL